jgi:predicted dehydrogenase
MKEKEENKGATSRRDFVKQGAIAAAAFSIVPRHVLGKGFRAPSDTLYVATIGIGGKGSSDIGAFVKTGKAKMAFLCDVDQDFAGPVFAKYPEAKRYVDYRELFDKEHKHFDAVSVATPDNTHAVIGSAAMQLGKHTWLQKPMAHDVYEARMLGQLAKKYKVVTQMGNQGASGDGVRQMREWYEAGVIGDVHTVYTWTNRPIWPQGGMKWPEKSVTPPSTLNWDLWQGPAKERPYPAGLNDGGIKLLPFNWRGWWDYGTGVIGDMGAHILDAPMTVLGLGLASSVQASVSNPGQGLTNQSCPDNCPASSYAILNFAKTGNNNGPVQIHWMDGGLMPPRPEELDPSERFDGEQGDGGGMIFIGTKGKMMAGCYASRARLLPVSRMDEVNVPQKYARVTEGHYGQWIEACLAGYGNKDTSSPFEKASILTENMLLANLAIRGTNIPRITAADATVQTGRDRRFFPARSFDLQWDAANMKVTNVDEVNQFVKREYRSPYKLSGI